MPDKAGGRSKHAATRTGKRVKRFIAASSFCAIRDVPNQQCRCMPRWQAVESRITGGGSDRARAEGAFPACGAGPGLAGTAASPPSLLSPERFHHASEFVDAS